MKSNLNINYFLFAFCVVLTTFVFVASRYIDSVYKPKIATTSVAAIDK